LNQEVENRLHKLMITHRELKTALKSYKGEHVLRYGEFGVMMSMLEYAAHSGKPLVNTGVPMKILSDERNCTPAMITKLITGLEEQGYVRRELSTDDRRGVKVCVTQKGYEIWQQEHLRYHRWLDEVGEKMGMDNMYKLLELAEQFVRCCKDMVEQKDKKEKDNG
jgi:DNA-binding MarR family transcriptional regulator